MLVFQSGKVVTVAQNDRGAQVKTFTENGFTIEGNQQFTGVNLIALFNMISDLTSDPARNKPIANAAVVKIVYRNGRYTVPEIGTLKYVDAGKKSLAGE